MKKIKSFIIPNAITVFEFLMFVIWGKNMNPGDEMGFFIITTYLLFPLTTLIISAYLGFRKPAALLLFIPLMFAAQNFMPFILTGTFEFGLICLFTFAPAVFGASTGIIIKLLNNNQGQ